MIAIQPAFRLQLRVLKSLILRDMGSRHGGTPTGYLWMFGEPIIITLIVLLFHWGTSGGFVRTISVVAFVLTGYCPHLLLRHGGISGVTAVKSNVGLLYHRQIHFIDLVISRLIVEILFVLFAFLLIYLAFWMSGLLTLPQDLEYFYLGWLLHIWFVTSICFLFTGLGLRWEIARRMFQPFTYLMIPAYGSFFMLYWVPYSIRNVLLYFPPMNATEIIRRGYFGASVPTYYNIPYTVGCCLALTFIGFLVMTAARSRIQL